MDIVSLKKSTRKPRLVNQSSAIANDIYQLTGQDDRNKSAKEEKITKRKLSLEHRKKYPVSNGEILRFLSLKKEQSRLKKIFDGEISSERHDILRQMFKTGKLNFGIYAPITRLAQIDFLADDIITLKSGLFLRTFFINPIIISICTVLSCASSSIIICEERH